MVDAVRPYGGLFRTGVPHVEDPHQARQQDVAHRVSETRCVAHKTPSSGVPYSCRHGAPPLHRGQGMHRPCRRRSHGEISGPFGQALSPSVCVCCFAGGRSSQSPLEPTHSRGLRRFSRLFLHVTSRGGGVLQKALTLTQRAGYVLCLGVWRGSLACLCCLVRDKRASCGCPFRGRGSSSQRRCTISSKAFSDAQPCGAAFGRNIASKRRPWL